MRDGTLERVPATFRPADSQVVLGISRATLYRWAQVGHITLYRRGAMTFARTAEVVHFITGEGPIGGPERGRKKS
ncbi:MAG: helix-turn-helix domain-containing protein [Rhodobacteraceae bacterium]|nr:helix-turn-helix domain-containing protein [Paracoccaceae bacterium]MBR9820855.1 helix-turn-helix domain-containing protein [Paracoccaceae bacterium]